MNKISWSKSEDGGEPIFSLQGSILETSRLDLLFSELPDRAVLDLHDLKYINSAGTREWIEFLNLISNAGKSVRFRRCSVAFVGLANIVANFTGGFDMESILAPYVCPDCETEATKVIPVGSDTRRSLDDQHACPECGSEMEFDELPEQYLTFLAQ